MHKIQLPIIIFVEQSYPDFYQSVEEAELSLEAIDVNDGLYKGYDSEGRLLNIEPFEQRAKITLAEELPNHTEDLRQILKDYLADKYEIVEDDLPTLLHAAINYRPHYTTLAESLKNLLKKCWNKIIFG